jgi:hypothetical protein
MFTRTKLKIIGILLIFTCSVWVGYVYAKTVLDYQTDAINFLIVGIVLTIFLSTLILKK